MADELTAVLDYAHAHGLSDRHLATLIKAETDRVRSAHAQGQVLLEHEGLPGVTIPVPADAVDGHAEFGWTPVKAEAAHVGDEDTEKDDA